MPSLGERVDQATKEVKRLAQGTNFASRALAQAALVYERYNYPVARTFIEGRFADRIKAKERQDLEALLEIMKVLHEANLPKPVVSYIIKKVNGLKEFLEEEKP
jgi:Tfp pilus assembly protein PilF